MKRGRFPGASTRTPHPRSASASDDARRKLAELLLEVREEREEPDQYLEEELLERGFQIRALPDEEEARSAPEPRKCTRRHSKGLEPAEDWSRVDEYLSAIHANEANHKGIRVRRIA
jgi:hypothetical protein